MLVDAGEVEVVESLEGAFDIVVGSNYARWKDSRHKIGIEEKIHV